MVSENCGAVGTVVETTAQEYIPWDGQSSKERVPKKHWRMLSKNDRYLKKGENKDVVEGKPMGERPRERQLHFFCDPDPECVFCEIDVERTADLLRRKRAQVAQIQATWKSMKKIKVKN